MGGPKRYRLNVRLNRRLPEGLLHTALMECGIDAVHHNRWEEALLYFRRTAQARPNDPEVHFWLAMVYRHLERYDEALTACNTSIELDPEDGDSYLEKGHILRYCGEPFAALDAYRQSLRLSPDDEETLHELGLACIDVNRLTEAIRYLERALRLNPKNNAIAAALGNAYLENEQPEKALEAYQKAARIDPTDAVNQFNLGLAYFRLGLLTEAIEAYREALRLDSRDAEANFNLGLTYVKQQDWISALEAFQEANRLEPENPECLYQIGRCRYKSGDWAGSLQALQRVQEMKPNDVGVHYSLALAYMKLGQLDDARTHYEMLDQLDFKLAGDLRAYYPALDPSLQVGILKVMSVVAILSAFLLGVVFIGNYESLFPFGLLLVRWLLDLGYIIFFLWYGTRKMNRWNRAYHLASRGLLGIAAALFFQLHQAFILLIVYDIVISGFYIMVFPVYNHWLEQHTTFTKPIQTLLLNLSTTTAGYIFGRIAQVYS